MHRIILSGGGTGGHIFPAIAIAIAIKDIIPNTKFLFVGAKDKMEMEKIPAAGFEIEGLWISGFQRKFSLSNLLFPLKILISLIKGRKIIKQFKPDVVIGTGGFASGPILQIASNSGIPTVIQEQNSFPGITNKILGKKATKICVAYEGMEKYFPKEKIVLTGNPVRKNLLSIGSKREEAIQYFNLRKDKKTILVIGGSLGARSINNSILNCIQSFSENNIQLIWQTGKLFINTAIQATTAFNDKGIVVVDFITKMEYAYEAADIIISRAGAISISELCIVKKPCILIPLPTAAEDHQTKNAQTLVQKNAAILIPDNEAKEKLLSQMLNLISDNKLCDILSANIGKLAKVDAASEIAKQVIQLIEKTTLK